MERQPLLKELALLSIEGATGFSLRSEMIDLAPRIALAEIGKNFSHHFVGKQEKHIPPCMIQICGLVRAAQDPYILEEAGEESDIWLSHLSSMLKLQGRGEEGLLRVNGYPNICFIRDATGMLWTVTVGWSEVRTGWVLDSSLGYVYDRPIGSHVLVRHQSLTIPSRPPT